jgi:hypothetical protein
MLVNGRWDGRIVLPLRVDVAVFFQIGSPALGKSRYSKIANLTIAFASTARQITPPIKNRVWSMPRGDKRLS